MTFKYTEIVCYQETEDGVPVVCHEREAQSLEDAVATLDAVLAADINAKYVLIRQQGQMYPCWDTRVGAFTQPSAPPAAEPQTPDEPAADEQQA